MEDPDGEMRSVGPQKNVGHADDMYDKPCQPRDGPELHTFCLPLLFYKPLSWMRVGNSREKWPCACEGCRFEVNLPGTAKPCQDRRYQHHETRQDGYSMLATLLLREDEVARNCLNVGGSFLGAIMISFPFRLLDSRICLALVVRRQRRI